MSPHLARHDAVRKKQRYYDHFLWSDDCTLYCSRNINSRQRNTVAMWITLLHLRHTASARDCSPFHELNRLHMKLVRIERNDERFFVRNFLWIIATHESNEHERQQCSVFTGNISYDWLAELVERSDQNRSASRSMCGMCGYFARFHLIVLCIPLYTPCRHRHTSALCRFKFFDFIVFIAPFNYSLNYDSGDCGRLYLLNTQIASFDFNLLRIWHSQMNKSHLISLQFAIRNSQFVQQSHVIALLSINSGEICIIRAFRNGVREKERGNNKTFRLLNIFAKPNESSLFLAGCYSRIIVFHETRAWTRKRQKESREKSIRRSRFAFISVSISILHRSILVLLLLGAVKGMRNCLIMTLCLSRTHTLSRMKLLMRH